MNRWRPNSRRTSGRGSELRRHIEEKEREVDGLVLSLGAAAERAVEEATAKVKQQRDAHDALVKTTATVKANLELARHRCDPKGIDRLRAEIEGLGVHPAPEMSVEASTAHLARAKDAASEASATVVVLQHQLDATRPRVAHLLSALGASLPDARQKVEDEFGQIVVDLRTLESHPVEAAATFTDAVRSAMQRRTELEAQVDIVRQAVEAATGAFSDADRTVGRLNTEIASRHGELNAIDRAGLEAKLHAAINDPVLGQPDTEGVELDAAAMALEAVNRRLQECDSRFNAAKGQLHLVAGHTGSERLAQQEEAVRYAREEVLDRERTEMAALRLLNEIRSIEAERTSHLGRTLAGPITDTFRALTGGRYGHIGLDPDLRAHAVAALGAEREVTDLSIGTREQLATLIRLAIAAHLRTAVVLDDQLVHSDSARMKWFRHRIGFSVREHRHQVIVFTCRPDDYLSDGSTVDDSVTLVDLEARISRRA